MNTTRSAHDCGIAPRPCVTGMEGKGMEGKRSKTPGRSPHPSSLCEGPRPTMDDRCAVIA